jgi:hypothetical protein
LRSAHVYLTGPHKTHRLHAAASEAKDINRGRCLKDTNNCVAMGTRACVQRVSYGTAQSRHVSRSYPVTRLRRAKRRKPPLTAASTVTGTPTPTK